MYVREDLPYNLICYINTRVIKADEFRKNIGITNNQSVLRERDIIATIMKAFAKENMVRQYKIDGLPFDVDLCFTVLKLVVEIDENGHVHYDDEKHQIRQKLIENLGFTFIRINPDVENFGADVEIARIHNDINKSSVKIS